MLFAVVVDVGDAGAVPRHEGMCEGVDRVEHAGGRKLTAPPCTDAAVRRGGSLSSRLRIFSLGHSPPRRVYMLTAAGVP